MTLALSEAPTLTGTAVYRLYDAEGCLLYVGVSCRPEQRFAQHATEKVWWCDVATIEMAHHANRSDALVAEREAIKEMCPRYNVVHNERRHVAVERRTLALGDSLYAHPCEVTIVRFDTISATLAMGRCTHCNAEHVIDRQNYERGHGPWQPPVSGRSPSSSVGLDGTSTEGQADG